MKKENNAVKITGIVVGGVLLLSLIVILAVYNFQPRSTMNVQGSGDVEVVPDMLNVNFRVQGKGDSSAAAKNASDKITDAVIAGLLAEGFSREEIQTKNLNVYENYDWSGNERKMLGYVASHTLTIEMSTEDLDNISNAVDAGVYAGATIDSLNYFLSDDLEKTVKAEAIIKATENAKVNAENMIKGLDGKLGRIVQISESYSNGYYPLYARSEISMDIEGAGNIQPEMQTQNAGVSVVYEVR